jgi:hypothetical protein
LGRSVNTAEMNTTLNSLTAHLGRLGAVLEGLEDVYMHVGVHLRSLMAFLGRLGCLLERIRA